MIELNSHSSFIITFDGSIPSLSNHSLQGLNITSVLSLFEKFIIALKINLFSLIHPAEWTLKDNVTLTAFIAAWERLIVILLGTFFLLALKRQFRRS